MTKKGQVTIFVILGIILVIGVFLFFVLNRTDSDVEDVFFQESQNFDLTRHTWSEEVQHLSIEEAQQILEIVTTQEEDFQLQTIESITAHSIYQTISRGGIISEDSSFISTPTGPVIKVSKVNNKIEPTIDTIENQLESKICKEIDRNMRANYANHEEIFNFLSTDCSITLGVDSILVNVRTLLELEAFNEEIIVTNFEYTYFNLREIIKTRDNIINNFNPLEPNDLEDFPDMTVQILGDEVIISFEYLHNENFVSDYKFAFELKVD